MLRSLDARKHVALVLVYLSAAFDTNDHCILLEELHRIGVRGDALRWMSSHLVDRTQWVSVDDHLSCEIRLQHGVPQDSVSLKRGIRLLRVGGLSVLVKCRRAVGV